MVGVYSVKLYFTLSTLLKKNTLYRLWIQYDLSFAISAWFQSLEEHYQTKDSKSDFIKPNMEYLLVDHFLVLIVNWDLELDYKILLNVNYAFLASEGLFENSKSIASKFWDLNWNHDLQKLLYVWFCKAIPIRTLISQRAFVFQFWKKADVGILRSDLESAWKISLRKLICLYFNTKIVFLKIEFLDIPHSVHRNFNFQHMNDFSFWKGS